MAIGDLQLPLYPWGSLAPMLPQLPKAQSNVTASGIPSAIKPFNSLDFLNSMNATANTQSENALRQQQMLLTGQNMEMLKQKLSMMPEFMKLFQGTGLEGQPSAVPGTQPMSGASPSVSGRDLGGGLSGGGAIPGGIAQEASRSNFDPRLALATADIESDMGGNLGRRGNIFQLGSDEWNSVGGGRMGDPGTDIKNGVAFLKTKQQELASALGRDPTPSEIYLAHQQGTAGALKLLNNPDETPEALGLGAAVANNHGNPNAPASAFVGKIDGLVQARLAKYAPPDTVENAPTSGSTPAAQGYTGKVPAYERAPQLTTADVNLQSTPLAVHDAFIKYRQQGGQLPIEQFMAGGNAPAQPVRLAQNGPVPSLAGNLPQQGSMPQRAPVAPQMTAQMPGSLAPLLIEGKTPAQWARIGAMGEMLGMPNVAAPMMAAGQMNPAFKYQQSLVEALAKLQTAQEEARLAAIGKNAVTPEQVRSGSQQTVPTYDAQGNVTGVRQLNYNPPPIPGQTQVRLPNGEVAYQPVPGGAEGLEAASTLGALGPAKFKQVEVNGPYGQNFRTTEANAAAMLGSGQGAAAVAPGAPGGGNLGVGGALPGPTQQGAPGALPTANQRPESAPLSFTVPTPSGPKNISDVQVEDLFPNGQGIAEPPKPKPGQTYGPASAGQTELQKGDADRVLMYGKEAAENQKGYQDLGHLRDVLDRGNRTSNLAPLWSDLGNLAQGFNIKLNLPVDPNDAAAFNKAATDLTFAAVKKMGGRVLVSEIEGFQRANPSLVIPAAANYSILNDVLTYSKWQDQRARLAQEYLTKTGGAPLAAFENKFNSIAPLDAVTNDYRSIFRSLGAKFPGDQEPAAQKSNFPTQTLGGKTYEKRPDGWYLKVQ